MIKPNFWVSQTLTRVSRESRLLFIGLWNFSDDYGILEDSNRRILGDVFPYDTTVTESEIQSWKESLIREQLLVKVAYKGHNYLFIRSWNEHQKVSNPGRETIPTRELNEILVRVSRESNVQIEREIEREIINTPLTPQGAEGNLFLETERKLVNWFKGMSDVPNPVALAKSYLKKYPVKVVASALGNSGCIDRAKFSEILNYKLKTLQ